MTEPTPEALHPAVEYGLKSQTHVWALTSICALDDAALDRIEAMARNDAQEWDIDKNEPVVAVVTPGSEVLGQVIDCILCEAPYDQMQRRRKCPGRRVQAGMRWKE